ncbi:MAG: hypothetical protein KAJ13_02575, partial [Gemmatimonadetes bacterium]|nr:hypothetical protein [Gemmatimonadota bacterium]
AEWDGTVRDSAGVQIVQNFGTPLWTQENRWTVSEVLRIGTVEGEPEYQFGAVWGLTVLSDGTIVVADAMAHNLRFFSPDGVHLRTVGKSGSGPREFGGMMHLVVGPGDTLVVSDWANMQAHWLAPDGTWLGSWSFVPQEGWELLEWDDDPSGRIVTMMSAMQYPDSPVTDTLDLILSRDIRGAVLDTLGRVPSSLVFAPSDEAPEFYFHAGASDIALTWDGGMVTGRSDQYRLLRYDAEGRLKSIVSLEREKLPFTSRDRDVFMNRLEIGWRKSGASSAEIAQFKPRFHFADTYPAWQRIVCGPEGSLWVQQILPYTELSPEKQEDFYIGLDPVAAPRWDVFDREGRYLGVVEVPEGFFGLRRVDDMMYGIWNDELEVQHVMVLRIEGLPPLDEG